MAVYDLGDQASVTFYTRDINGLVSAPGALPTATVTLPDGTTTAGTVTLVSVGTYRVDYMSAQIGLHGIRALWTAGASAVAGSYLDSFDIADPAYLPLVSLADAKDHLNIPAATVTYDDKLRTMLAVAMNIAEEYTDRVLSRRTLSCSFSGSYLSGTIFLRAVPVVSVTSVVETGATLTAGTDYVVDKVAGLIYRGLYPHVQPWAIGIENIVVTYVGGYASPPPGLQWGVKEILRWMWQNTQESPRPGYTSSADQGLLSDALPKWLMRPLDPYVMPGIG